MKPTLGNIVSSRLPVAGLLAYSIQLADQLLVTECIAHSLDRSTTQDMLAAVVRNGRELLPAQSAPANYCWTFEQFKIYVTVRADGAALALVVENHPGVQMVRLKEMRQEFSAGEAVAS